MYKNLNHDVLDYDNYERNWLIKGRDLFIENYQKQWKRTKTPKFPDVVLFKGSKLQAIHAGIYIHSNSFLHCIKAGVVRSRFSDSKWGPNVVGYFRFKYD